VFTPFPRVSDWVANHDSGRLNQFLEYQYGVQYHLEATLEAERKASSCLWNWQWGTSPDARIGYILDLRPEDLIRNGDYAIRSAASTLDTALILTTYALGLTIDKRRVDWSKDGVLKKKLRSRSEYSMLTDTLESIFCSIGYELLVSYRNWVTHRGAPVVTVEPSLFQGIPLPFPSVQDEQTRWLTRTHLSMVVPSSITVTCARFVPPVAEVINKTFAEVTEDVHIPGIHIGAGARDIVIENHRVAVGGLEENADEYRRNNPMALERHFTELAGEEAAAYSALDYIQGVLAVSHFARSAVTTTWDEHLAQVLHLRHPDGQST
jgi:hypothetical protein